MWPGGGGIPGIMGCWTKIFRTVPKRGCTTTTDLARITIRRVRIDVPRACSGLCGLCSRIRIFLESRRWHRRWRAWMGHVRGLLGLGRCRHGREHGDVTFPAEWPLRRWRGAVKIGLLSTPRNAPICAASTTLLYLNGLKSSLMCTGGVFFNGRVPKNGLGGPWGVGLASDGLGLGELLLEPVG